MLELLLEGGSPLPPLKTGGNRIEDNLSPQFWRDSNSHWGPHFVSADGPAARPYLFCAMFYGSF